jgi:hypothetical protein
MDWLADLWDEQPGAVPDWLLPTLNHVLPQEEVLAYILHDDMAALQEAAQYARRVIEARLREWLEQQQEP